MLQTVTEMKRAMYWILLSTYSEKMLRCEHLNQSLFMYYHIIVKDDKSPGLSEKERR